MDRAQLITGGVMEVLPTLEAESVQCVVTSPPFWGLRAYGTDPQIWGGNKDCQHEWTSAPPRRKRSVEDVKNPDSIQAGNRGANIDLLETDICFKCGAWRGELGLEPTPEMYVEHLVLIFREVRRVLRADGTVWLNMGDSYASIGRSGRKESPGVGATQAMKAIPRDVTWKAGGGHNFSWTLPPWGLKPKDLCMMTARVAMALQADGWWLRSDIIWSKPNPMPESVTDRPTTSHEHVFLLTRSAKYYYDADAIREPHIYPALNKAARYAKQYRAKSQRKAFQTSEGGGGTGFQGHSGIYKEDGTPLNNPAGRNKCTVWTIPTQPYPDAHFATFPEKLVEPCILAGTSEVGGCPECGKPWERVIERSSYERTHTDPKKKAQLVHHQSRGSGGNEGMISSGKAFGEFKTENPDKTLGWHCPCKCDPIYKDRHKAVPCVVADFFMGSGTVGKVALKLRRKFLGCDLNPDYVKMARKRMEPLLRQKELAL